LQAQEGAQLTLKLTGLDGHITLTAVGLSCASGAGG
jgi:hypothetical protein